MKITIELEPQDIAELPDPSHTKAAQDYIEDMCASEAHDLLFEYIQEL